MGELKGVALVTGAARGLGRAIAAELKARGAEVVLSDQDEAAGAGAARAIGGRFVPLDVRSMASVNAAFAAIGAPDMLVNNAGIYPDYGFLDITETQWLQVIDINLNGAFRCAQAFARARVQAGGGGAMVNLASTAASSARVGAAHYSTSKAGLAMLTRSLAQELGPHRIRVNAVAPGLVDVGRGAVNEAYYQRFLPMIPLGRVGMPEDVAKVVAMLLSEDCAFVTGAVLPIDGGFLAGRALPRSGSTT
jgi:3-oxoacyl-[acyl-carrier protein] reductase